MFLFLGSRLNFLVSISLFPFTKLDRLACGIWRNGWVPFNFTFNDAINCYLSRHFFHSPQTEIAKFFTPATFFPLMLLNRRKRSFITQFLVHLLLSHTQISPSWCKFNFLLLLPCRSLFHFAERAKKNFLKWKFMAFFFNFTSFIFHFWVITFNKFPLLPWRFSKHFNVHGLISFSSFVSSENAQWQRKAANDEKLDWI